MKAHKREVPRCLERTSAARRKEENLCLHEDTPLGGTLVYETGRVVHTQYISANLAGKNSGALDLLFDYLINKKYADIPIFDFGQSTENSGYILNENLIFQKEGFGGRGVMYNVYEYTIE